MNKTLIALAIVAALPVAAQADATISGTLTTKYKNTGVIDTDARLSIATSEVLANGMTATASFAILADSDDDTENQGTATLAGDFGLLTVGEIDSDGAFQAGDVAGVVSNTTYSTSSTAATSFGISYSGSVAGLNVAAQVNAGTDASGSTGASAATSFAAATGSTDTILDADEVLGQIKSTQMSATYNLNGLTVGYAYASDNADRDSTTSHDGVHEGQSAFGVSYAFGDLVVTAGKVALKDSASVSPDAVIAATYTMTADALTVVAQMDNYHSATDSNDYQINLSYALNDMISLSSEIDKNKTTTMVATYTSGNVTATVAKTDDGTTDASVTLDYGNADLTIGRVGARAGSVGVGRADKAEYSHVSYKVAF